MFVYNSVSKKKANHCIDICYVISFYPAKISFEQLFVVHYFSEVPWLMIINIHLFSELETFDPNGSSSFTWRCDKYNQP